MTDTEYTSLRMRFMGQALTNSVICNGQAPDYKIQHWFGDRRSITTEEIVAKQAVAYADAMMNEITK